MKRLTLLLITSLIGFMSIAQIHWEASAVRYDKPGYQLIISAKLDSGWHIYSSFENDSCISIRTTVTFISDPALKYIGEVNESGIRIKHRLPEIGSMCMYLNKQVTYYCYVQPKNKNAQTEIKGTVKYQICTDSKCLPPAEYRFGLKLPTLFGFRGYPK